MKVIFIIIFAFFINCFYSNAETVKERRNLKLNNMKNSYQYIQEKKILIDSIKVQNKYNITFCNNKVILKNNITCITDYNYPSICFSYCGLFTKFYIPFQEEKKLTIYKGFQL